MKCDHIDCDREATMSALVDPFGKSDAMRNLCPKHAPETRALTGSTAFILETMAIKAERDALAAELARVMKQENEATANLAEARKVLAVSVRAERLSEANARVQALEATLRRIQAHVDTDEYAYEQADAVLTSRTVEDIANAPGYPPATPPPEGWPTHGVGGGVKDCNFQTPIFKTPGNYPNPTTSKTVEPK